jgi:hypothetical protein
VQDYTERVGGEPFGGSAKMRGIFGMSAVVLARASCVLGTIGAAQDPPVR